MSARDSIRLYAAGSLESALGEAVRIYQQRYSAAVTTGCNPYAWVMQENQADVFLTYYTNAVQARAELKSLRSVPVPPPLAVGANFGLTVLDFESPWPWHLALYILSAECQRILARFGFEAGALSGE